MNQNKPKKRKMLIVIVAIIIAAFIGYSMFFTDNSTDDLASISPQGVSQSQTGDDLLVIFAELSALNLSLAILSNPVFVSLEDFSREIPSESSGRTNPFAPI